MAKKKEVSSKVSGPIKAEVRSERGSRKAQAIRAAGMIPGVLYGRKAEVVSIVLPSAPTELLIHSGAHVMDLELNGKVEKVLIKAVQYDSFQIAMEHVDLMRIDPNQRVRVKIPLEFRGTAVGTKEGGILEVQLAEIELEVPPLEIPDSIRVNVEALELHQMIHAKEVQIPSTAKLVTYGDLIVCQVRTVKEEVAAVVAEAGAAEPEVIGKKKEEEGAEGEAAKAPAGGKAPAAAAAAKAPAAKK